jgi:hypothetical protein
MQCGGCCLRNSIRRPLPSAVRMFISRHLKGAGPLRSQEGCKGSSLLREVYRHTSATGTPPKHLGPEQSPQSHHTAADHDDAFHMDRWSKRHPFHCLHHVRFLEGFSVWARCGQNSRLRTQRFSMELHAACKGLDGNHRVSPTTWIFQCGRHQALDYLRCLVHPRGSLVRRQSERNPATDSRGL